MAQVQRVDLASAGRQRVELRTGQRRELLGLEVRVATIDSFRATYLRDVSSGGLFVRSARPLAIDSQVVVQLTLASLAPVSLPGVVVRHEPGGFGVRLSALEAEQRAGLEALLRSVQPTASSPSSAGAPREAVLQTELAEARGAIEAYEQTLALLREAEMDAVMRAEQAELERSVLVVGMKDLSARVSALEQERASLQTLVATTQGLLQKERELVRTTVTRNETERASLRQLEAELEALRRSLSNEELQGLRREVQTLAQLADEERLKALAMQRALERFVSMGGSVPGSEPG